MGIKQEIPVVKSGDDKKALCVDDIVTGIENCQIGNDGSQDKELAEILMSLKLEETKMGNQKPWEGKSQPKEDDERDGCPRSGHIQVPDNLIKLEAPSANDSEDDEENLHLNYEEEETYLGERGPMLGVPANYNVEIGHNYIASKSCKPYQTNILPGDGHHLAALPANFPDYSYHPCKAAQVKGSKREMEEREVYHEPQKWVRPQVAEINNLNTPWNQPNSGMVNANGKTVHQVYQKQMSGGTVFSAENMQYPDDPLDLFEIGLDDTGFNIQVDMEDFLPTSEPPSPQPKGVINQRVVSQMHQMPDKMSMGHQQQWRSQQSPLPPVSQFTNSFNHHFQQQQLENYHHQAARQYQDAGHRKRGSFGNDDYSDGYVSDLSPSHEIQSPPAASPSSVMDASPATYNGSPPRTNWSPPPSNMSNMSHSSFDSGVCSPMMSEDQSGYTSMTSPRQGHSMSPQNLASLPATPQMKMVSTSPPHHHMSPAHTTSPPYQTVAQDQQGVLHVNEDYVDPFIDAHLTDLDCALEVAGEDLMAEKRRKGFPLNPLQHNISPAVSNMNHMNGLINNINIYPGKVSGPAQNISVAVAPPSGDKRQNNIPINNQGTKGKPQVIPVSQMQQVGPLTQKPQIVPNLPTTVPTTISVVNKNIGIYQPTNIGINQSNMRVTAITNSNNNNTIQPSVHGKIAIPPMNPKPKTTHIQSQMLPVFVTTSGVMTNNGMMTPVIIMPQNVPQNTPPRKLPTLIPKEPVKQLEKIAEISAKPTSVVNPQTNNTNGDVHGDKTNGSTQNGKKPVAPSTEKLLNLARRLVAEMPTSDLKYKDEDRDTYLHVAVCRADRFMVQALLERLVREKLTEMIDMQNLLRQTPLYLAVSTNHAEMVQLLIEQGADVNPFAESVTSTGQVEKTAAIHCASTKGEKYLDTLKALLKAPEINLSQVNSEGQTALNLAILAHGKMTTDKVLVNSIPIIRALIHAGADPNFQVQQNGKTALMYALESRDLDLIESTFQLVDPQKLQAFLNTQAFDSSSCAKIAESLKTTLDPAGQQRLFSCLRPMNSRGFLVSSSS